MLIFNILTHENKSKSTYTKLHVNGKGIKYYFVVHAIIVIGLSLIRRERRFVSLMATQVRANSVRVVHRCSTKNLIRTLYDV